MKNGHVTVHKHQIANAAWIFCRITFHSLYTKVVSNLISKIKAISNRRKLMQYIPRVIRRTLITIDKAMMEGFFLLFASCCLCCCCCWSFLLLIFFFDLMLQLERNRSLHEFCICVPNQSMFLVGSQISSLLTILFDCKFSDWANKNAYYTHTTVIR